MINNKRLLALIPARSGSKRLPHKNSLNLGGKPLIAWSIDAGLQSKYVDRVVVSTESNAIAAIAKHYGADIPFIRPEILASDTATTIDVVRHAISMLEKENDFYDYILLLQPTSPLRKSTHIDKAFKVLKKGFHNLVSVSISNKSFYKSLGINGKKIQPLFPKFYNANDQKIPNIFEPNGAIYIFLLKEFLKKRKIPINNLCIYVMSKKESLDINSLKDFKILKKIMRSKKL